MKKLWQLLIGNILVNILLIGNIYAFDLNAGADALLNPMVAAIGEHFGKAVLAACAAGALVAQGDLRTRAIGAGIGGLLAGGMLGGIRAIYGI
ncbi:MAG: hypothetical protein Tsb006_5050 [Rickettsiaceae bacterium]